MTTQDIRDDNTNIHTKEPPVVHHDIPVEPKEALVKNQPQNTKEQVVKPSIELQTPSIPFPRSKEDTAYMRLDFTRKRVRSIPNTVYPADYIRRIQLANTLRLKIDNPNITMEEYIRLQEEKALSQGETFNWQTATYGKMEYCEDEDDCFTNFESAFPAIVLDNTITAREALSWEPTVSPLNDNEIDFRISFDESDDED
ncbi:hypothetical protein Tco_1043028 [Tanacetum coccineum]|uniref:Uncharacterized protein n=1 Tax=Tanacetum coccineum TaxID=301880 RepID=A0ABQ5GKU9_9ASTR